jgi:murein DD-endopeptidase MepM/ murein hydrolase activator NlpD
MQGFLTLPFAAGTAFSRPSPFGLASVFDLDAKEGSVRAYDPGIPPNWEATNPPWVMDNHIGVDFCFPEGTEVRAAMPGVVTYVGKDDYGGLGVWLCHGPWANYYNHNSNILVAKGETVDRGQVIALSGNTGQSGEPHLHFSLTTCTTPPEWIDPYRDLSNPGSVSYWTVDNAPQYP